MIPVESPKFKAAYLPSLTLDRSKDACWSAVLVALKEREYELKESDPAAGSIETGRRKFNVNATMSSGSGGVTMSQLEQSDKLWISITGDDRRCVIDYVRVRLWNGEEEMQSVQHPGGDWFLKNVIAPLNREIIES